MLRFADEPSVVRAGLLQYASIEEMGSPRWLSLFPVILVEHFSFPLPVIPFSQEPAILTHSVN